METNTVFAQAWQKVKDHSDFSSFCNKHNDKIQTHNNKPLFKIIMLHPPNNT